MENSAPTVGPMILPTADGMAIKPRYVERSSSVVISARITCTNTSTADHIRVGQDFTFSRASKLLQALFILAGQFPKFGLELVEFH